MAELGQYCKAYLVQDFRQFDGWCENLSDLQPQIVEDDDGQETEVKRSELHDDDVLYLQENWLVTDGVFKDEHIVFDQVSEQWQRFCTEVLEFAIPADILAADTNAEA